MPENWNPKVGDLVRFAKRADRFYDNSPIYWTGNDTNGVPVAIHELTPAIVVRAYCDSAGNSLLDVFVMNKIVSGWYDSSFEEWWEAEGVA